MQVSSLRFSEYFCDIYLILNNAKPDHFTPFIIQNTIKLALIKGSIILIS